MSFCTLDLSHIYGKHDVDLRAEICGYEWFETTTLALRYVQTHWKETLNRKLLAPFSSIVHVCSAERPNST